MSEVKIEKKSKLVQFFCRHKNSDWFKKSSASGLMTISGEKHLKVCKDCGKIIDEQFVRYEGMGFK